MSGEPELPTDIVGHKTMYDGTHEPITRAEGAEIWAQVEAAKVTRLSMMPNSMAALQMLQDALTRLHDEGWSDGIYCPKGGDQFAVIQFGSTGIFQGFYSGEWPDGHLICGDFVCRPEGILWKWIDQLSEAELEKLEKCTEAEKMMHEREIASFGAMIAASPDKGEGG